MNIKFRLYSKKLQEYVNPNDLHLTMSFDGDILSYEEGKLVTDEYIIEQFTGLYDKDGKEIFHGDIVVIVRQDGFFGGQDFMEKCVVDTPEYACLSDIDGGGPDGICQVVEIEILGNIRDNPELLS